MSAIRTILAERRVVSQSALRGLLEEKGYAITQATLSRDLKLLNVGKRRDSRGGYYYVLPPEAGGLEGKDPELADLLLRGLSSVEFSGKLGVIRTLPGYANSVASGMDSLGITEILGTIAGDDTILVIPRDGVNRQRLIRALVARIPGIKEKLG